MPLSTFRKFSIYVIQLAVVNMLLQPACAAPANLDQKQTAVAKKVPFRSPAKDRYGLPIAQIERLLEARNAKEARAVLAKVPRCKGDEDRRNMILGAILATDSNFDAALPLFTKVKHPEEAVNCELYTAAKTFALAQNFPKAIEIATIAIDRSNEQKCLEIRASCYSTMARFSDARQDYETLARTKPLWASDYLAKEATLLSRMNKPNEALVVAERAVKADPTDCGAQMVKGACLEQLGRYGEAVEVLTITRNLAKKTVSTKAESTFFLIRSLEKRAVCYQKMGKINEAERDKLELKSYSDKLMDDLVGK
ncbi:tetratricopeptide repeat protein [bacterium]|jgi:Flp pilus assembly protein TadD|nr:tetratricopeptide repeat protein [bacterium]